MQESKKQNTPEKSSDEDILKLARERFDLAVEAEASIRELALDDLKFMAGEQWPEDVKRARDADRRPCLTINRIPQFVRQITNDQRQNRPAVKVSPVDDLADIETAKIYQGIIRHIEYSSGAENAYDTAFESAASIGFGYIRVVTDYCDPYSFDQDIKIKRVADRFSIYMDPAFQEPDGSDANFAFAFEDVSKDQFKAQWPDSQLASMDDWTSVGESKKQWVSENTVRIAEYFYKEFERTKVVLILTPDGQKQVIEKSMLPKAPAMLPEGMQILDERETLIPKVKWCKINGVEVLEKGDWAGRYIPIVPVLGEEHIIEGKRQLSGVVRYAKDPQRMYNYWASSETEAIALAPRAPFIGFAGQFEGHERKWQTANVKNHAYLEVNPTMVNGQLAPLPQRNSFEPAVQAITQARMLASDDMKATTGIYDAALGGRSNETSGIAIQRRNVQAQTSNFHLIDNLSKSIRHVGRICLDLIPKIYDTERAVRILGEGDQEEIIRINQEFEREGKIVRYDLGVGRYDVTVATGPSFETKRQEAVQAMLEFTRAMPQTAQAVMDLLVKNMDWPGADEIAGRLKKMLPPGLADENKAQDIPPEVQAQLQQSGQMIEQLSQALQEAQSKIETKALELQSKERIEFAKLETQATIELAKLESNQALNTLAQQIAELDQRTQILGMAQPFAQMQQPMPQEMPQELPPEYMNQDFNGAGPEGFAPMQQDQMLTGEQFSPGQPVE